MDSFVLTALLALPLVAAAVILAVSSVRRRRRVRAAGPAPEPRHRGQAGSAAAQAAEVRPAATARPVEAGRTRRADAASGPADR